MRRTILRLSAPVFGVALVSSALALEIERYTIDGGGGQSTGGTFAVTGTIGQPDAGLVTGGDFQIASGFWLASGVVISVESTEPPATTRLRANAPNPFNPLTTIRFDLAEAGAARVAVYDVAGRLVRTLVNGPTMAGEHRIVWQGRDESGHRLASGVYFLRMEAGEFREQRRMVLLK